MSDELRRDRPAMRLWGTLAAIGAVIGATLRYLIGAHLSNSGAWPVSTLTVNLVGAFLIGALSRVAWVMESEARRHFLTTGVLGGFTTFSAIAVETVALSPQTAMAYLLVTIVGGIALTALGARMVATVQR
mgnify:CR=1 FL=1